MAQRDIQSVLQEDRVFPPSAQFSKHAALKAGELSAMYAKAAHDYVGFWADLAVAEIDWHRPFTVPLDDSHAPNFRWFTDGQLNVSHNCLDVHLADRAGKIAIVFEGEKGDVRKLTYAELHAEVCRFANALKNLNIARGDRVVIYMPLIPEAVIAMQACARIGAVHSVVFGGFSSNAVKDRIEDAGAKLVITADGGWRGGHAIELKRAVDKALADGCPTVQNVVVYARTGGDCPMSAGRDIWWRDAVSGQQSNCEPEWVDAEHPLFLLYTSGSTGKPKGIQHSSAGYLLNAKTSTRWVFDLKDDDVFWCTADVGWVTGHTYVAYGPLAAGATILMYEGAPTFPDGGRFWKICQTHGVTILYTAPTAIRALMKLGDAFPAQYDLRKLRLLGSVGEPINPEAWMWYHKVIGAGRCPIVDTWWQTETGAAMMTPIPSVTPTKPGSCAKPLPGIFADIVDDEGRPVKTPDGGGYLVIKRPWPSMLRTIWGDNDRYLNTYWEKFRNRYYVAGDSARRDKDGYYWIMGRIDDVLNVAGHRLGTMEIESALVAHPRVAESAVVSRPHEIKGESVFAYVVLNVPRPEGEAAKALIEELRSWVGEQLSPIAKPDEIRLTENLPKTRSGKIMRRLLRSIARGEEITQDMSTLENPAILEQLKGGAPSTTAEKPIKAAGPAKKAKRVNAVKPVKAARAVTAVVPVKGPKPAKSVKGAKSAKRTQSVKRVKAAKRVKTAKRVKATKQAKAAGRVKATKSVKVKKQAKAAAKRGTQVKHASTVKRAKRPAVAGKSRRAAVKSVGRKARGKK
jgi:acetyl-CoA synthetase